LLQYRQPIPDRSQCGARISMSRRYRTVRKLYPLLASLATVTLVLLYNVAYADAYNATVKGDIVALKNILAAADMQTCPSLSCRIASPVIRLSLKAPHFARLNVKLVEAKVTRPNRGLAISSQLPSGQATTEPILLRGYSRLSSDREGFIPVAATLSRDGATPVLEVALPRRPQRGTRDQRGLVVFRAPLTTLLSNDVRNSRVQAPPAGFWSQKTCGVGDMRFALHSGKGYNQGGPVRSSATFHVLYVGTDYDPQFASQAGCKTASACHNKILSTVHKAAVFYQDQLGYTLEVARQFGPTQLGRATTSEVVLDTFQQYNFETRFSYQHTGDSSEPDQVDLFQLFTGKTMDDDTIGVAYVGTACRNDQSRFADAVIQRVSDTLDPTTLAHEIGHSLSAVHTSTGIMRPALGKSPPSSFASSSLLLISNHLSQWYSECRQGTSDGYLNPTPTPTSGGNSNDNSNPFRGKPVTIDLNFSSSTPKSLTVITTTSKIGPSCSVRLHVGASAVDALRGAVISDVAPTEATIARTGSASFQVSQGQTKNPYVYFVAEHTCPDGSILEVSRVRKYNPNRIRGISKKIRSKRAWIKNFTATLR
jgi:hypothetical protein